jgi:predicted DNA-binding protein
MTIALTPELGARLRTLADRQSTTAATSVEGVLSEYVRGIEDERLWIKTAEADLIGVWPTDDFSGKQ